MATDRVEKMVVLLGRKQADLKESEMDAKKVALMVVERDF